MKITPGTSKPKDSKSASFTKTTSGQPEKKANTLKIPEGAKDVSRTIRKIHNGYIVAHSFRTKDSHEHHEVYHPTDPLAPEGAGQESKETFGHVKGLD